MRRQVEPEKEEEEELLEAKRASDMAVAVAPGLDARIRSLRGHGQPLDTAVMPTQGGKVEDSRLTVRRLDGFSM